MKQRTVRIAVVNPDGTETIIDLAVGETATVVQPFAYVHDRYEVAGKVRVPIRRVS